MMQIVIDYYYYFPGMVHGMQCTLLFPGNGTRYAVYIIISREWYTVCSVRVYTCSTVRQGRPVSAVTNKKGRQANQKEYVLYIESVCNSYIGRNKIKGEAYSENDWKKIHRHTPMRADRAING